jgi:haloacetate dehalogenase
MFEDFDEFDIAVAEDVTLHGHHARLGPDRAVALLRGSSPPHATWARVTPPPRDAGLRVVCPDLRGYGRSTGRGPDVAHEAYSDRAMA